MKIKICGITSLDDAETAVGFGADALGFVLAPKSPRAIRIHEVTAIVSRLPAFVTTVGVFVNPTLEEVWGALEAGPLDLIQLHGDEPPDFCAAFPGRALKAIRVKNRASIDAMANFSVRAFVLDNYDEVRAGGTGKAFDWSLAEEAKMHGSVILAGGLTPENVGDAIRRVQPYGVDVSSGVEASIGKKDPDKVRRFIANAKDAARKIDGAP